MMKHASYFKAICCAIVVIVLLLGVPAIPGFIKDISVSASSDCPNPKQVTGGFLINDTVTLQVTAKSNGPVNVSVSNYSGNWQSPQKITNDAVVNEPIKVTFTSADKQRGKSSAFQKAIVTAGSDCYVMQAAASAPFMTGTQFRETTQTIDYVFMRAVNASNTYVSEIVADKPGDPLYYDVDYDSLAVESIDQSRRYYLVYSAKDVNSTPPYYKLQFLQFSLGSISQIPSDLTFGNKKPNEPITDKKPVIAVAPNGSAAVAFVRAKSTTSQLGVIFINSQGQPASPSGCDENGCELPGTEGVTEKISIAATATNKFVIAWERETEDISGASKKDIGIATYDAATLERLSLTYPPELRGSITSKTNTTKYFAPSLASFNDGQQLYLTYMYEYSCPISEDPNKTCQQLYGRSLNQDGTITNPQQPILDSFTSEKPLDTAFLDSDILLVVWLDYSTGQPKAVTFHPSVPRIDAVADLNTYDGLIKDHVGVMRDFYGRGVVSWSTQGQEGRLYYALIDANSGGVITPAMLQYERGRQVDTNELDYINLGSGFMATSYQPEPMFQINLPLLRK